MPYRKEVLTSPIAVLPAVRARDMVLAIVAVSLVTLVRVLIDRVESGRSQFMLFALSIVVSAFWGGFWSGMLATLLSAIMVIYLFVPQHYSFFVEDPYEYLSVGLYFFQGILISGIGEANRRSMIWLEQMRSQLETRVQDRTVQLEAANADLRDQISENERVHQELKTFSEQLQRSNRELQDFASVASHDLQEPLRKIQAFGDRLRSQSSEVLAPQSLDYLARMLNAAQRMQVLINDLLSFSRVTTKAQPFRPVDLQQIVEEVAIDLEARIEEQGAEVISESLPTIEADPMQMRQLFQNLISNALKFRKPDVPPVIRLTAQQISRDQAEQRLSVGIELSPGAKVFEISVADNGIGFDEKYLDRIFSIFQRLHGRGQYEGTGIGLAVCRKIVERHGGSITAKSSEGHGAIFLVTLPALCPTHEATNATIVES